VTTQQVKDSWPQILDAVQRAKRSAWMVVFTAQVRSLKDDVLTLSFPSDNDVQSFRQPQTAGGQSVSEYLRQAIIDILGIRVKFIARADGPPAGGTPSRPSAGAPSAPEASSWPGAGGDASAPAAPARPSAMPSAAAAPSGPASTASLSASSTAPAAGPAASAVVTEWATVTIPASAPAAVATLERPQTSVEQPSTERPSASAAEPSAFPSADDVPPDDLEAPEETEPPYESAVPEEPAGDWEAAPAARAVASAQPSAPRVVASAQLPAPAGRQAPPTAGAQGSVEGPAPDRPTERSAPAAGSRTPTFQAPQRYGEAVVREILGATFLEEQPAPPSPGVR
jgi:DNA polymerase-3 subunit gamma/tau